MCDYLSEKAYINREVRAKGAVLSGLSVDGCILLPMKQKKAKTLNTVDSDKKIESSLLQRPGMAMRALWKASQWKI